MQTKPADFYHRTRSARKIIVVDFGFLGDSVHLVPALWEIKRHYPEAELHTLSAVLGAELLKLAPCVDRAWAFPLTPKSPAWWRHGSIIGALRREHFDVAFNLSGSDRSIFVTALMGARWTLGWEAGRKHFWNRWLAVDWVERGSRELPVFEQRRQVLAAGGFALQEPRFDLRVPEEAQQWAKTAVAGEAIHLSISASTSVKEWPLENWISLTRTMGKENPSTSILATAGSNPREIARLKELATRCEGLHVQCLEGLTIARLAALLQRCRLQIGADSGVLHLAMALGIPTLGIFRQYDGLKEWMPAGKNHGRLVAQRLDSISPEQAAEQVCQLLR